MESLQHEHIICKIESLTQELLEDLFAGRLLEFPLRTASSTGTNSNRGSYSFPGTSTQSAWRFTVLVRILNIVHNSLVAGIIVSKRDIFYQDPDLFKTQAVVDRYVDSIVLTFGVSRNHLNIVAESKGLFAGALYLGKADDQTDNICYDDTEGMPVPTVSQSNNLSIPSHQAPRFLLLMEKKATFHTLSRSQFHIRNNCFLLTGQGYPDLATRSFLHHFHSSLAPQIPCYALVDFDPDGICIYNVYSHGSQALSHERNVSMGDLEFLGLRSSDAFEMIESTVAGITSDDNITVSEDDQTPNFVHLSFRERQRGKGLLNRLAYEQTSTDEQDEEQRRYMLERWEWTETDQDRIKRERIYELKRELQVCLMIGYKVELQILDRRTGGLEAWIMSRLSI